jgi:hypothetical protein
MELLEGQTLKQMIEGGSLPIEQVVDLGSELADALQAAHARASSTVTLNLRIFL